MTSTAKQSNHRLYYIIEATIEYFVSILVTGAFLTNILNSIGVSDAVSGIVTSLTVFAQCAQIASSHLTHSKGNLRRKITILLLINELLFALLYIVPFFNIGKGVKTAVFIVFLITSRLIMNYAVPAKLNWLISKVPSETLGDFTAKKEMTSLLTGMLFTFAMGFLSDYFAEKGDVRTSFIINALVICMLSALHIYLLHKCDAPDENPVQSKTKESKLFLETLKDKNFQKLLLVDILWHINSVATSFFGVYQLNTLGFSMTAVSALSIVSSFSRAILSLPMGHIADKTSWANLLRLSFGIVGLSYFCVFLSKPSVFGVIMFALYSILHAVSMAGINGGLVNVTFSYISNEKRTSVIGIRYCVGGITGFLSTLVGSVVVEYVQSKGNVLFGYTVYPQQILSLAVCIICFALVIYISKMFCGSKTRI